jgi:hypothetical protein
MAINFPLKMAFAVSHFFWLVMFSFSLTSRSLLIFSFISSMTHWSLSNVFFSFQLFTYFFLLLSSIFNAVWSDRIRGIIFFLLYLFCALKFDQFWRRFRELLRRMYIVQKLTLVRSNWSMVWFRSRISLLIFCLDDLSIGDRVVLNSPTTTVLESICVFGSSEYVWWNWMYWCWVHIGW